MARQSTSSSATKESLGSVRDEHRRLTRRRLLQAALDTFAEKGYTATTVEDLVAGAEVARATFYLHFENKLAVVEALTEDLRPGVAALYEELDDLLATGEREAVRAWMSRAFGWFEANTTMVLVWQQLLVTDPTYLAMPTFFIADHMPGYLAQWPEDQREAARLRVVLLVNQLTVAFNRFHIRRELEVDDEVLIDTLTDLWISALKPEGRARPRAGKGKST